MKIQTLTALLLATSLCLAEDPAGKPDPAGTILLDGSSSSGVTLIGGARKGLQAGMKKVGGGGNENVISLGAWGKDNSDEIKAEFTPAIPKAGYYDVYVRWISSGKASKAVASSLPLKIHFDGGERTVRLSQQNGNVWAFLGTYPFQAGTSGKLVADATGTQGASNIDGVKFVPVSDPKAALSPKPKLLPVTPGTPDDLDKLRIHAAEIYTPWWNADITSQFIGDKVAEEQAETYLHWKTMQKGEGITDLWTDISLGKGKPIEKNEGGGWQLVFSFHRIFAMAQAYAGSNAPLGFADKMQGNPELLQDILYALNWSYENRYNERSVNKLGADWIGMEIQNPMAICKTIILLYPNVPPDLIKKELATIEKISPGPDKYYGGAVSTGFNRMFGVLAYAQRAIVAKDPAALDRVNELISGEYQVNRRSDPITEGRMKKNQMDGYFDDGSFIQHAYFPYIGIYGRAFLGRYAELRKLLEGSKWAINDPRADIFNQWVYKGYAPLFFGGEIMFGSLGRSTGQSWHQNGAVSSEIVDALAPLAEAADPENKQKISAIIKTWLVEKEKSAFPQFSRLEPERLTPESFGILDRIKNDPSLPLVHPEPGTHLFYNTDYAVHHQPGFAMQLRMFSTRTKTHEDINEGTNRLGWYQGEGTLFLYDRDNSRYNDNFWATVNPYRLPGTTVDVRPRETPGAKDGLLSSSPWAGGVVLDGFGLASMGLEEPETTLTARKAWFFFGDQIVCLGSEIKSSDDRTVESIVENTKLHGEGRNAFVVDGKVQPAEPGWNAAWKDAKWAHLTGTVPGTDVGWVFPGGAAINALREARKGNWQNSFKTDRDGSEYTRNFLTIWYDHGKNPAGASYAYIILPGRSVAETEMYAGKPGVEIIENSGKAQAARCTGLGITGANFWTADQHTSGAITSSGKAAVLVLEKDGKLSLAVSDPTQLEKSVEISLEGGVSSQLRVDEGMKVLSLKPLRVSVNLEKSDGRTFQAEFSR